MKERLEVLHKVYKMAGPCKMDWVIIDSLVKELGMEFTDVNDILIYWEQKGLLEVASMTENLLRLGVMR